MQNAKHFLIETLQKAGRGPGSRGGKILGYTKTSHKAVYMNKDASDHKGFSSLDHTEAADLHQKTATEHHEKMLQAMKYADGFDRNISDLHHAVGGHIEAAIDHDKASRGK